MTPGSDSDADVPDGTRRALRRHKKSERRQLPVWQETIVLLGLALGLAIVIKALFVQAFYIPSESMEPGLAIDDRILVEKPSYWGSKSPQRGDVVVFKDPGGWLDATTTAGSEGPVSKVLSAIGLYPSGGHLVKRVIGVAGDTISCCDARGRLSVNGYPLDEEAYVADDPGAECRGPMPGCQWTAGPVPEGKIFVMGDNRGRSADSSNRIRKIDPTSYVPGEEYVPVDSVVGKVFVLLWPRERWGGIGRPDSFNDVPDPS